MNDPIEWLETPEFTQPTLLAAFSGCGDAADTATSAVRWLVSHWHGTRFASIPPSDFFDFTVARPNVRLDSDGQRVIAWPRIDIYYARPADLGHDMVLIHGREPHLHWPEFADTVIDLARRCGVNRAVTLGAFLGPVLHSAPVPLTGFATSGDLTQRLLAAAVESSSYQGPTGMATILQDAFHRAGIPSLSLWAATPFYLGNVRPNPRVSYALIAGLNQLLDLGLELNRLSQAADYFDEQVTRHISQNQELTELIAQLGARTLTPGGFPEVEPRGTGASSAELPSAEIIIKDLEDFLRRRQRGEDPGTAG